MIKVLKILFIILVLINMITLNYFDIHLGIRLISALITGSFIADLSMNHKRKEKGK